MSLPADILIWLLLAVGIGFGALGLFGLVIFPDIRSRMYTAVRATLIGFSSITAAVLIYAATRYLATNGSQYFIFGLTVIFLYAIIVIGTLILSREIQGQIKAA